MVKFIEFIKIYLTLRRHELKLLGNKEDQPGSASPKRKLKVNEANVFL